MALTSPDVQISSQWNRREHLQQDQIQSSLLLLFLPDQNTHWDASSDLSQNDVAIAHADYNEKKKNIAATLQAIASFHFFDKFHFFSF